MADPTETGVDPYPEGISNVKTDPTTGQVTHFTEEPPDTTPSRGFLDALYLKHSEPETGTGELPSMNVVPVKWPDWDTARFEINTHQFREEYNRNANEFRNRRDPSDRSTSLEVPKPENVFTLPDEHPNAPAHSDMVQYRRIAFEAYEKSKIPLVVGSQSNLHRQPMPKDVWLEDLKEKKDRGIWTKAGAFSAAAGVGAKDFIKNGFITMTDTVFLGFMEEGYWKSLGEGSSQGMVGFGQMLDSALYHSAVPGTGNIFLDTEDPVAVDKAYEHYRDKHYNANVMQDGLAFTPKETQYWSNFNQHNPHGEGKWTDKSGNLIHGPVTVITSQVVDPTLLAFIPVGVLAKPLARAGAKGFMWTVSKGAGATRVAAETGAKVFSKPRTMVDNIMSRVGGQPGAGGAVMGATTKIEAGFAIAANYAGRVEDVARVMSTKSGQRRFLQRLILDPKIRGTKTQKLALIAYQASGTEMADKVFNILIDTASAGGVSAAFAFAAGGSVEEAGYSWGASGVMGGTSGAAFGPAGSGKTTDVTQRGKLSGRTKEDVKNIQPRLQQVGEATYESISPGQATTDAQIARNERALAQWKEKLTQGLPEEQKARLDEMNSGELHEFFKKKFGEQSRDQFNALPPEVQGMYTTMTAVHGDVMPKFFVFDSKAELARFYDSLFNDGDGTITEKNGPEGVYDKNLGMVLLHKGQGGRSSSAVVLRAFTHEMAHATIGVQIDKMLDGSDGYGPERILWEGLIKEIGPQKAGEATVDFQIHDGRGAVKVDENGNPQTVKVGLRGQEFARHYNAATGDAMGTNATILAQEMLAEGTSLMFMEDSNAFNHMTHAGTRNMETVMRGTLGRLGLVDRYGKIIHIRRSEAFQHGNNMSKTLFAFANNPKVKRLLANYTKVQELNQLKAAMWDNDGVVEQPAPGMTAGATFASRHTGVTQVTGEMRGILSDASRGDAAKTHSRFAPVSEIGASDVVNVKTEHGTVEATVGEVGGTTSRKKITTLEQPASLGLSSVESGDTITVIRDGNSIYTKSPVENRGKELTDPTGVPFKITDGDTVVIHGPDGTLKSMVENATKTDSSIDGVFKARTEIPSRQVTKNKAGHSSTIASEGPGGQGQRLNPEFYSHLEAKGAGGRAVAQVLRQIEAGIANNGTLHFAYSKRSSRKGNNAFMEREVIPTEIYISKGHARPSVRGWDLPSIFSNIDQLVEHGMVKDGDALKQKMVDLTQEIRERTRGIDPNDPSVNLLEAFEIGDPLIAAVMGARIENVVKKHPKLGNLLEQLNELGLWKHLGGMSETSTYRGYNIDTMQALRVNYGDVINFQQQNVSEAHLPGDQSVQQLPGFHSQVEQVVQSDKIPNRASPQQILATLRKQPGVKEQELKWLDLEGFTEGKKSVSKEELLEHINLNKLEVEVVELAGLNATSQTNRAKYESPDLTTPGYKPGTYRELLFRVPERGDVGGQGQNIYTKGHYGSTASNVFAHTRVATFEKVDPVTGETKTILHATELQSDWHKDAREHGVGTTQEQWRLSYKDGSGQFQSFPSKAEAIAAIEENNMGDRLEPVRVEEKITGVPKPPFEGTWHQFTLKALVRYAAENGFDEVAWITGEQTQARYDLSHKVNEIHYSRTDLRVYDHNGDTVIEETGVSPEQLAGIIGKEVAERLMTQKPKGTLRSLTGEDLKVGGEWADNLYNKALPKAAQKMFKKFGATVRRGELDGATDKFGAAANALEALKLEPNEFGDIDLTALELDPTLDATTISTLPPEFLDPGVDIKHYVSKDDFDQGIFNLRQKSQTQDAWFLEITPEMKKSVMGEGQQQWLPGDYQMRHRPADAEYGAPLHDVTQNIYPPDFYGPNGARYYGSGDKIDQHSHSIISRMRGNPDGMVTVFRAVPKDVDVINPGDWVTINNDYAKMHGEGSLQGNYKILQKQVPAKELFTEGNSMNEWGWNPGDPKDVPQGVRVDQGKVHVEKGVGEIPATPQILQQFLPAGPRVNIMDYKDVPIFLLLSDRMGTGVKQVGPAGHELTIDGQGGPGHIYVTPDGIWRFSTETAAKNFLTRARNLAGPDGKVLAGITVMEHINHLNSHTGRMGIHRALEAARESGLVPKRDIDKHVLSLVGKIMESKAKKTYPELQQKIKHVKNLKDLGVLLKSNTLTFTEAGIIGEKMNKLGEYLHLSRKDTDRLGISSRKIAEAMADPELVGLDAGTVVGLIEIDISKPQTKSNWHKSYPWQVNGKAIGYLDTFKHVTELTSSKDVKGQPGQTVMPEFDKLRQQHLPGPRMRPSGPRMRPSQLMDQVMPEEPARGSDLGLPRPKPPIPYRDLVVPKLPVGPGNILLNPGSSRHTPSQSADDLYNRLLRN